MRLRRRTPDDLLAALLRQHDLAGATALLSSRRGEITSEFLDELIAMGNAYVDGSQLGEAATVFAFAREAAHLVGNQLVEAQLAALVAETLHELGHAQAEGLLRDARALAEPFARDGELTCRQNFLVLSLRLAALADDAGDHDEARRLLAQTRRRCREWAWAVGELSVAQDLLHSCLQAHDLRPARAYAQLIADGFAGLEPGTEGEPDRLNAYALLVQAARAFYYDEEDYALCAEIAQLAMPLAPDDADAHFVRGNALVQLQRWQEAADEWEAAIARPPVGAGAYINYASTLLQLDRPEDALAAATEGVARAPTEPRYLLVKGQIEQVLALHDDAIADFGRLIEVVGSETPGEPPGRARSIADYMQNAPASDFADLARAARVNSYRALGHETDALDDIAWMIREGDDATRFGGYRDLGDLHADAGRLGDAVAAYSTALELVPDHADVLLARADAYLAEGAMHEALADLAAAAQRDRDPEAALERLDRLVAERPNDPLVRKWRGYAAAEAWRPQRAIDDLTKAIGGLSDDPDLFLWRGLARLTASPHPGEPSFDRILTFDDLVATLDDVAAAARLAHGEGVAYATYAWLVDRLSAHDDVFAWLVARGDEPDGLFTLLPAAREAVERLQDGIALGGQREWARAVEELRAAESAFAAADLPVSAARVNLHLTDNLLRLFDLQAALDCIAVARKAIWLHARPLTAAIAVQAEEHALQSWESAGRDVAAIEVDYAPIYGVALPFMKLVDLLEAQVLARVGAPERALAALGDLDEFREYEAFGWQRSTAFHVLITLVTILRDAGQLEDALSFVDALEKLAHDAHEYTTLHNTAGTVLQLAGAWEEARDCFLAASRAADTEGLRVPALDMNLASALVHLGDSAHALEALERVDPTSDLQSIRERFGYQALRAQVLHRQPRDQEALQAAKEALTLGEDERAALRVLDFRMGAQGRLESFYRLAVEIAHAAGQSCDAFELAERSRSRALVDQLAAGRLPLPPEARPLERIERNLRTKRALIHELKASLERYGSAFLDPELLRRLDEIEPVDVLEDETGGGRVSPTKLAAALADVERAFARIQLQLEDARRRHAAAQTGAVLSYPMVRRLLAP